MISWIICGILLVVCIVLGIRLSRKLSLDKTEQTEYESTIKLLQAQKNNLNRDIQELQRSIEKDSNLLDDYIARTAQARNAYLNESRDRTQELDNYFSNLREQRQLELDTQFAQAWEEKQQALELRQKDRINEYDKIIKDKQKYVAQIEKAADETVTQAYERASQAFVAAGEQEEKFKALLEPLRKYEMDKQARLYYTIQVPDEYKDDIDFLLTTVSQKVQHHDVINKLVYTEYVKPYLEDLFKRIEIKAEPGIYKITSLVDGKCYIGKSTNIKKRLADHMKSSCGIATIAHQNVHDAIRKQGYWNWTIEPIIYCDKEKLGEMEKYYIDFFKAQEFGYNKRDGG